jgi:hypothetical protein
MAGYGCYCTTGGNHWVSISNYQEGCLPQWIVIHGSWCNGLSRESLIVGERLCGTNFSLVKLLFGLIAKLNAISFRNILYPILIHRVLIVQELCEQDCEDDAQIDLDVPRTISEHIFFRQRYGAGHVHISNPS